MPKRDVEADLIKQMYFNVMPPSDEQLVGDMRDILKGRDVAFNAWMPITPEGLGNLYGHAEATLRRYFSGQSVSEARVFRRPEGVSDENWNTWEQIASQIDWGQPVPSIFSPGGPIPHLGIQTQRVREDVARRVVSFEGYDTYPGLERGEGPGIAMEGALQYLSGMSYLPANPQKAAQALDQRINRGIVNALSGYNKQQWDIEKMEVGFDFEGDLNPSDLRAPVPWQLEHRASAPAGEEFPFMGDLTPEKDAIARQILGKYAGIRPGDTLTVGDAYQLYNIYEGTMGSLWEVPDDLREGLRQGTGLENEMRKMGTHLRGLSSQAPPEVRVQAANAVDPTRNMPSQDPLVTRSIDDFEWGGELPNSREPFSESLAAEGFDPTAPILSTRRDMSLARLEAARSTSMGPLQGPAAPPSYPTWVQRRAVTTTSPDNPSMSPAARTRAIRQSAMEQAYANRGNLVSGVEDQLFDAYQAYAAGSRNPLSFDDWLNSPEVSGVNVPSARNLQPGDVNTEVLDRIEGMSMDEFQKTVGGVTGQWAPKSRPPGTPMPEPGSGRMPSFLNRSRQPAVSAALPEPLTPTPSREVLTLHGYRRTPEGQMKEQADLESGAPTTPEYHPGYGAGARTFDEEVYNTPPSAGQPSQPPSDPPGPPKPPVDFPTPENPEEGPDERNARYLSMLSQAAETPYQATPEELTRARAEAKRAQDRRYQRQRFGQWAQESRQGRFETLEDYTHNTPSALSRALRPSESLAALEGTGGGGQSQEPPEGWNEDEWRGEIEEPSQPAVPTMPQRPAAFSNPRRRSTVVDRRIRAAAAVGTSGSEAVLMSRRLSHYVASGEGPETFVGDYDLQGEEAELARAGDVTPGSWAAARSDRFAAAVRSSAVETSHELDPEASPETHRAYSLALESVSRANEMGVSGHETTETMIKNLSSRARQTVYDTLNEEIKQAGGNLDVSETNNRVKQLAETVIDGVVGRVSETLLPGQEVSPGALGGELHKALTLKTRGQAGAIQELYQQDELFRTQVDSSGGLADVFKRGGVFDRGDGSQVKIMAGEGEPFSYGEGGGSDYRSIYGPIRAWYASRAMKGVLDMTLGQSLQSMAAAEPFEQSIAVEGGLGPGPIQSHVIRQANNQVYAGIAAEEQFGWMMDIPEQMLGNVGSQRMYQAGRFAAGVGTAGYMANALIRMSGATPIAGLGGAGLAIGAGYLGLAGFAEVTGRDGVGEVMQDAASGAYQLGGGLLGLAAYGAYGIGSLFGASKQDFLESPVTRTAMAALEIGNAPSGKDTGLIKNLEDQYAQYGGLYDITQLAQSGAQLTRIFGSNAPWMATPGSTYANIEMAQAAQAVGIKIPEFATSAYQYASERYPQGLARLTGMVEYAQMSPQEQFAAGEWADLSRTGRSTLMQAGVPSAQAWQEIQGVFPTIAPEQTGLVKDVTGLSAMARGYGIDVSVSEAQQMIGNLTPTQRQSVGNLAGLFAQQLEGRPYAELDFTQLMDSVLGGGYTEKQLGAIGQLAETFVGSGQSLAGMAPLMQGYAASGPVAQQRVRELAGLGGALGVGTQWLDVGTVSGLSGAGYGVFQNFLERAYQGGGADEFGSLFGAGTAAFGGLGTDQLNYAWGLTTQFQGSGMSWTDAAQQAGQLAPRMDGLQYGRFMSVYDAALNTGTDASAAARYAEQTIGATGLEFRDLTGVLRGDPWSLSRLAQQSPESAPPPTIDLNTGMSVWQEQTWALQDQAHNLQYQSQTWNLGQQQQQFNINQAMQWGGTFFNPLTGQNQTIPYGQFDISDAMFQISTAQQRDAFAYQEQQLGMSSRYQRQGMQSSYQQTMTRMDWREADWAYQENVSELNFAWQMEDYDEAIRFASGRDRQRLMRQRDRAVISESMREGHSDEQRDRMDKEREWAEEAHKRQEKYFEDNFRLQEERLKHDKQYFEERLQWQTRERELARTSAELEAHYRQAQLTHQQQVLAAEESIYQRQTTIDRERIRVQGEIEVWLQSIADWVEQQSAPTSTVSGSSISRTPASGTRGTTLPTPYADGGTPDLFTEVLIGERQPETAVYASGHQEVVGRHGQERAVFTEPVRIYPSALARSDSGGSSNHETMGVLQEILRVLRDIQTKGLARLVFNYGGSDFKSQMKHAEDLLDATYR
jgi:hypothetical protein